MQRGELLGIIGLNRKHLAVLLLCVAAAACQEPAPEVEESRPGIQIGTYRMMLDGCTLAVYSGPNAVFSPLELSPPCRFVTQADGAVRIVETPAGSVLLVEASKPVPGTADCDTQLRAVVVGKDAVRVSTKTQRIAACPSGGWDEMMYQVLANSTQPL